jgi:hypothetical protein
MVKAYTQIDQYLLRRSIYLGLVTCRYIKNRKLSTAYTGCEPKGMTLADFPASLSAAKGPR